MYKIRIVNKQFSVCPTCHPQLQKNNGGRDNASIHGDDFVVSSLSCVRLVATPWTVVHQASLFFTTSGVCSNLCPLSQWCHSTISSSVIPFSSLLQSFPASGSFPRIQFFASGGQNTGASTSASVLPMIISFKKLNFLEPWLASWNWP